MYMVLAALILMSASSASALTAVINGASPGTGEAPLAVAFDSTGSSTGAAITYLWRFGDGGISSAQFPTHIFTTAGTYDVVLQVSDGSSTETATIPIVVTGSGAGPLTDNVNLRWAPEQSTIRLKHNATKRDTFFLSSALSTVDLPPLLTGLFVEFRINGVFSVSGNINRDGAYSQRPNALQPGFTFLLNQKDQKLSIKLRKADLAAALAASNPPMLDADVPKLPKTISEVTLGMTIGSQSYAMILGYRYVSSQGRGGNATFRLRGPRGRLVEGFWVVREASALENTSGDGHFFEFNGALARPLGDSFTLPPLAGTWKVQIGDFIDTIPADRLRQSGNGKRLTMRQPDRERGGVRQIIVDLVRNTILVKTWDLKSEGAQGTGLPLKGENFKGYNMVFRLDFQPDVTQPDAFDFQAVTASRLTRRGTADALWQTGRGN
jgi:PKD repeat protein